MTRQGELFGRTGTPSPAARLTDRQRLDWLRLIRCESVGPLSFRALVNRHGGAGAALDALPDLLRRNGRSHLRLCTQAEAEAEMAATLALGARFVALGEADYPAALAAIDSAPPLIALRGQAGVLARPCVALVGARNASAAGLRLAEQLAAALGSAGLTVVSGLARGIDQRAHQASLATGTAAVLAGGLARPYPAEHAPLIERIVETGCILSEMPLASEPRARDFPRRNRIVSGLSLGTVVVEAARRSGSLITARFALEQGREVFAAPGSPLDPRAEGANDLIKQGATMVTSADDVLEVLQPMFGAALPRHLGDGDGAAQAGERLWDELDLPDMAPAPAPALAEAGFAPPAPAGQAGVEERVVALLGPTPVEIDDIARLLALDIRTVQAALFDLDLAGRLERSSGGRVALR